MAIAQMNWGRMLAPLDDPRMAEFAGALDDVYRAAEAQDGFIWRIPDEEGAGQLTALGHDALISATVSVWTNVAALRRYTFMTQHGQYLERAAEWFEPVEGPQLVIWDVASNARPSFKEAFNRLDHLRMHGPSAVAHGWPS